MRKPPELGTKRRALPFLGTKCSAYDTIKRIERITRGIQPERFKVKALRCLLDWIQCNVRVTPRVG